MCIRDRPTPEALHACLLARDHEGLRLEPTYTGKALAALWEREGLFGPGLPAAGRVRGPVLFVNTHNSRPLARLLRALAPRPGLVARSLWTP